jgi:glycosyltransferase involved in cell wall biosynthesis
MPDIIHAHSVFDGGIFGIAISKKYNIPLVITEHLTHYITGKLSLDHDIPLATKIFKETACSLVVGNVFKNELAKAVHLPASTFRVVYNMVSDIFFTDIKEKKYQQGEEFIFFTNSFLNPRKNHPLIFKSLKKIIDKGFKAKLIVGGYGETAEELKNLVVEYGLQNNIEFTGSLSRVEVKKQIDNCHAFLLASTYETFGVVLIEALAGGKPVITTDSGGPKDIVKSDRVGYLLKSFEVEEFTSAMESMITNYANFDQQEITNYAQDNFSENVISQQLVDIYKELIQKKPKSI